MAEKTEEKDGLFTAFEKLKVETDWALSGLKDSGYGLKMPESDTNAEEESVKLKSPNKSYLHRAQPYPKDRWSTGMSDLQRLDDLTLTQEACSTATCHCNIKKRPGNCFKTLTCSSYKPGEDCVDASSTASGSASPKHVVHDARLKLHHKAKDQKFVLRAARFKLSSGTTAGTSAQKLLTGIHSLSSTNSPKLREQPKASLFGSKTNTADTDFKQVAKEAEKSFSSGGASGATADTTTYGTFRSPAPDPGRQTEVLYDLNALRESLTSASEPVTTLPSQCPVHPGRCPKPCSCAHQARLDDWSDEELACYFEEFVHIPKKMSMMAEMMYT